MHYLILFSTRQYQIIHQSLFSTCIVHHMVYLLLEFTLILPVATATIEKTFSTMNGMSDGWLNDYLVTYIKRNMFLIILRMNKLCKVFKMRKLAENNNNVFFSNILY